MENTVQEKPTISQLIHTALAKAEKSGQETIIALQEALQHANREARAAAQLHSVQVQREVEAYNRGCADEARSKRSSTNSPRAELCLKFCEGVTDEQLTEMIAACQTKQPLVEFVSKTDHHIEELTTKNRVLGTLAKAVISLR